MQIKKMYSSTFIHYSLFTKNTPILSRARIYHTALR